MGTVQLFRIVFNLIEWNALHMFGSESPSFVYNIVDVILCILSIH